MEVNVLIGLERNACKEYQKTMGYYFNGTLEEIELRHFLNHVARCNRCLDCILEMENIEWEMK